MAEQTLTFSQRRQSLLSSESRVQAPYVKVTIGTFTFGVFSKEQRSQGSVWLSREFDIQYPCYVRSLNVVKINGQINTYTLQIDYPITPTDDPNMFEKVFSSVSKSRKIVFTYGDSFQPTYVYKNEEGIITNISQTFTLSSSTISYTISAISACALSTLYSGTYLFQEKRKPSDIIKMLFKNPDTGLQKTFTGMRVADLDKFVAGNDAAVQLDPKENISILEYLKYLVSCMIPEGSAPSDISKDIYILTIHDESSQFDSDIHGPYFTVERVTYGINVADAYEVDIGYNTKNIVTSFSIEESKNYSLLYDYQDTLSPEKYTRRINDDGQYVDVFSPSISSVNPQHKTKPSDTTQWTKITQFPINASITIQGLLRPAQLLSHLRLNVIFPGGQGADGTRRHISSGLYIVTKQSDTIDANGYKTQLTMTKISS